jgi:hypothetical protein
MEKPTGWKCLLSGELLGNAITEGTEDTEGTEEKPKEYLPQMNTDAHRYEIKIRDL